MAEEEPFPRRLKALLRSLSLAHLCAGMVVFLSLSQTAAGAVDPPAGEDAGTVYHRAESLRLSYEKSANLEAINRYEQSLELWLSIRDYENAALAANGKGATFEQLGDIQQAVTSYARAVELAERSGDRLLESHQRSVLGMASALLGDTEEAWNSAGLICLEAQALAGTDALARARAMNCLGQVSYARGLRLESIESHQGALALIQSSGDLRLLAETLLLLGYAQSDMRRFPDAGTQFNLALELWEKVGDKRGAALTLVAIARMQARLGNYQPALNQFHEASVLFEVMGDIVDLASCYTGMANIYMVMGQYENSRRNWQRALSLFEQAGLDNYVPDVLPWLGLAELSLGRRESGLRHLERALAMAEESGNRRWSAWALRHLGYAHRELGEPRRAIEYLRRLETTIEVADDPKLRVWLLNDIGSVYLTLQDYENAAHYFDRALTASRLVFDRAGEAKALFGMARAQDALDELESAIGLLEQALDVTESLRAEVASHELRTSYFASVHQYFRLHVALLMKAHALDPEAGHAEAAFLASERARARSLMEQLLMSGVDIRRGVDPETFAEEEQLLAELNALYEQRKLETAGDSAPRNGLDEKVLDLEARYHQAQARTNLTNPHYAALSQPQPVSLRETQLELLDDDTVLLEFSLGEQRSYLWLVTKSEYSVHVLPGRSDIDTLARSVYEAASSRPQVRRAAHEAYLAVAGPLSDLLLGPVFSRLEGKRIVIVPDGSLQYVPFGALPVPGSPDDEPMMLRHELVTVPSMSTLAVMRNETEQRPKALKPVAVVFDPVYGHEDPRFTNRPQMQTGLAPNGGALVRLSQTVVEADLISRAVGPDDVLRVSGFAADRGFVLNHSLVDYRIVHFATHAMFNESEPGLSGLVLAQFDERGNRIDGFIRPRDIYQLRLPAELVVLSACETALGEQIAGEGIVGIVRGFMYAGSKRVLASLWRVEDRATAELMGMLYHRMLEQGHSAAAALRRAQMHMWRQERTQHPFFWAAFILQGDWTAG